MGIQLQLDQNRNRSIARSLFANLPSHTKRSLTLTHTRSRGPTCTFVRTGQEIPCRAFTALHDRSNCLAGSESPDRTPGCHADSAQTDAFRSRSGVGHQLEKVPQVGGEQSSRYRGAGGSAGAGRIRSAQMLDPDEVLPRVVVGGSIGPPGATLAFPDHFPG